MPVETALPFHCTVRGSPTFTETTFIVDTMMTQWDDSVAGALAAVDMEDFAGHEARLLQIEDRVDDVGDLAQAADRVQAGKLRISLDRMHRRLDDTERHGVHPDAALGIFGG